MAPLYEEDRYLKEFDAAISAVRDGRFVVLDCSAFYPQGGGQPHDTGVLCSEDGKEYRVVSVGIVDGQHLHEVDNVGLAPGMRVHARIDWQRRYTLMRMHTAAHILSAVIARETGALISGNQLGEELSRIDFSLEEYNPDDLRHYEGLANIAIARAMPIELESITREQAELIPGVSKLAKGLSPAVRKVRIVRIGSFDLQACGGTHVRSSEEIGRIRIVRTQNKGKNNRRIYFSLADSPTN